MVIKYFINFFFKVFMKRFFLFNIFFVFFFFSFIFAQNTIECNFKDSCLNSEVALLYANSEFTKDSKILSSNVKISYDSNYNKPLCCKSDFGEIAINIVDLNQDCPNEDIDLSYMTDITNSRIGFKNFDKSLLHNFKPNYYSKKLCVGIPDDFSSFDIIVSKHDYSTVGYSCLYRVNELENGLVSSCDAKFGPLNNKKYEYIVWGRMWENVNSLRCNADCTSKLDNRIYVNCGTKIKNCEGVPVQCDGALKSRWLNYDLTYEIKCEAPWNEFRNVAFTNQSLDIKSNLTQCSNIVSKSYPVLLNNEQVNMVIYTCGY